MSFWQYIFILHIMILKKWRLKNKLTLEKASTLLNISVSELSRWENQLRFPRKAQLEKIINVTKGTVRPEDFF